MQFTSFLNSQCTKIFIFFNFFFAFSIQEAFYVSSTLEDHYWFNYVLCALLIIAGIVLCFFGYRLIYAMLFLCGFIVGFFITFLVLEYYITIVNGASIYIALAIAIIVGLIVGSLFICLVIVGIFFLGVIAGYLFMTLIVFEIPMPIYAEIILFIIIPLIFGCIAVCFQKYVFIVATAFFGAYLIIASIDRMFKGSFSVTTIHLFQWSSLASAQVRTTQTWIEIVVLLILAVLGVLVQLFLTSRRYNHSRTIHIFRTNNDGYA